MLAAHHPPAPGPRSNPGDAARQLLEVAVWVYAATVVSTRRGGDPRLLDVRTAAGFEHDCHQVSGAVATTPSIGGRRRSTASSANVGDRRSERIGVGQCAAGVSDTRRARRPKSLPRPAAVLSVCGTLLVGDEH